MTDAPEVRKRKNTTFIWIAVIAAVVIALIAWWTSRDNDVNAGTSLGEIGDVQFDTGVQDQPRPLDPNASTVGTDDATVNTTVGVPTTAGGGAGGTTNAPNAAGTTGAATAQ